MGQNSWNVVGLQLEVLERSWNIQEWTKNFHSNCIPVHSSSSVIIRIKSGKPGFLGFSVPGRLGGVICKPEDVA